MMRGGATVAGGMAVEIIAQFARTLILARLLGASEFGLVVSINTLAAVVEMVGFIGIDRYIVYAPEGGEQVALDVGHTLALLRALISAAFVLALAIPAAAIIGERAQAPSFAVVALVPLLRGAAHLGVVQMQRFGRFWPAAAADAGGAVLGALAAIAAAVLAPSHWAILWGLGVQTGSALVLTHVFARAIPFRLSFERAQMRRSLHFGLPLMANGIALAAASQLDRMVVGAWLGVKALGLYGLCTTLLLQPIAQMLRLSTTALQPRLSATWHADPDGAFQALARHFARYTATMAACGAACAACLGAPTVRLMFGHSYAPSDAFFGLMAGVLLLRLGRGALNLLALAIGRTSDLMVSNIVGAAALPVMIGAFAIYPNLESAAFGALVGEFLGGAAAHLRLRIHCGRASGEIARSFVLAALAPAAVAFWVLLADPSLVLRSIAAIAIVVSIVPWMLREQRASRRAHAG
jgi:O-antigen/teichoic acid export membrane protein